MSGADFTPDYLASVVDQGIPVRLAAPSFVIPVPKGVGSPMVEPDRIEGEPNPRAGQPILDNEGVQKHGLLFFNYADRALQVARDDGTEVILVNGITHEEAKKVSDYYNKLIPDPDKATAAQIFEVLRYAHEDLGIDDFFQTEDDKVPSYERIAPHATHPKCGFFLRRSPQARTAIVGIGRGTYQGPADSVQRFEENVVAVSNGKRTWMVQTKAFLRTYHHPDDTPITLSDLRAFKMQRGARPVAVSALTKG